MIIDKLGAGHYQTLEGFPVTIYRDNAKGEYPVHGAFLNIRGEEIPCRWKKSGESLARIYDLIPVPRKPREVYIERIVFERLRGDYLCHVWVGEKAEDFSNPVLFREVMEDEE